MAMITNKSKPKKTDSLTAPLPDMADKVDRSSFDRKLPSGKSVKVRATKVKRA